jgi:hypothetical protein
MEIIEQGTHEWMGRILQCAACDTVIRLTAGDEGVVKKTTLNHLHFMNYEVACPKCEYVIKFTGEWRQNKAFLGQSKNLSQDQKQYRGF